MNWLSDAFIGGAVVGLFLALLGGLVEVGIALWRRISEDTDHEGGDKTPRT